MPPPCWSQYGAELPVTLPEPSPLLGDSDSILKHNASATTVSLSRYCWPSRMYSWPSHRMSGDSYTLLKGPFTSRWCWRPMDSWSHQITAHCLLPRDSSSLGSWLDRKVTKDALIPLLPLSDPMPTYLVPGYLHQESLSWKHEVPNIYFHSICWHTLTRAKILTPVLQEKS